MRSNGQYGPLSPKRPPLQPSCRGGSPPKEPKTNQWQLEARHHWGTRRMSALWESTLKGTCAKALVHYPTRDVSLTKLYPSTIYSTFPRPKGSGESCCLLSREWWTFLYIYYYCYFVYSSFVRTIGCINQYFPNLCNTKALKWCEPGELNYLSSEDACLWPWLPFIRIDLLKLESANSGAAVYGSQSDSNFSLFIELWK